MSFRIKPYLPVALAFVVAVVLQLGISPSFFLAIVAALPIVVAALTMPPRQVVMVIALALLLALYGAYVSIVPLEVSVLRLFGFLAVAYVGLRLAQVRELAERRAEEAEAARQQVSAILESIGDAFYTLDRDWRFTYLNDEAERLLRRRREELLGRKIWEEFPEALSTAFYREYRRAVEERTPVAFEEYYPPLDGWFEVRAYPSEEGLSVYFQSITERKAAEAERERLVRQIEIERDRLSTVIENLAEGLIVFDPAGDALSWNRKALEMHGYTSQEDEISFLAATVDIYELLYPDGEVVPFQEWPIPRLLRGEEVRDYELILRRKGRDWQRVFSYSGALIRDERGEPQMGLLTIRDVTERKAAEAERERLLAQLKTINEELALASMQSSERAEQLRAIIRSMADAVYVVDAQGRVTITNDAGRRLLGLEGVSDVNLLVEQLPSQFQMRHLDGSPLASNEMPLARALAGETIEMEDLMLHNPRTGSEMYIRTSAAPIQRDGTITGAVAVAKDVTELIQLDRMKDDFIRTAAHELKTPVAIVKGYVQLLARVGKIDPVQHARVLEAIDRGADRMTRIVEDLLDISQLQLGRLEYSLERLDLSELVQRVGDRIALRAPRHRLKLLQAEPAWVQGDRSRLEQVMANLLDNAIRYSPEGGDIEVAVRRKDGEAVVSVKDYGVGIPRGKQEHIFERFYRAHAGTAYDYGGMGVGLYLSREIVRGHGGRMWFESTEGKGSTFCFALPLAGKEAGG